MTYFLTLLGGIVMGWHVRAIVASDRRRDREHKLLFDESMREMWRDQARKLQRAEAEKN